jgi:CoA:oxalate CoA-transferase
MGKILDGIRVLDFTDALAGPFCTRYLADCGCEIINVEKPGGKMNRGIPFYHKGFSIEFLYNHCGKKSIVINLKNKKSRELILELVKECDVVIENYRPFVMKGFGLDYNSLKKVKPSIIMCSISGYGQEGPKSELAAADLSIQAESGIFDLTGEPDNPSLAGFPVTDILAGLNAFGAICAALYRRAVTGEGDYIDIAMLDCALAPLQQAVGLYSTTGGKEQIRRTGRLIGDSGAFGIYKGKDGYIGINARTQVGWNRLCEIMGRPELVSDPRFSTDDARLKNNAEITKIIEAWLATQDRLSDVAALLQSWRMLAAPVRTVGQTISDPLNKQRGILKEIELPDLGKINFINSPLHFTNSKAAIDGIPPLNPGEHTDYVLKNVLKLKDNEIQYLKSEGVVTGVDKK